MNTETAIMLPPSAELVRQSTDVAGLCKDIVLKSSVTISGRKYVRVEGWQSIATAHGCVAGATNVQFIEGGCTAVGEIRRISDGALIATAEGFVGEDEPVWYGGPSGGKTLPKRANYAIRAMAQTRAISRVCRSAFAHVVVLMDAGLSTTPAEEVPHGGFNDHHEQAQTNRRSQSDTSEEVKFKDWRDVEIHFGKNKGIKLGALPKKTVLWYWENVESQLKEGKNLSKQDRMLHAACALGCGKAEEPAETVPTGDEPDADPEF